jgi:hypothetical protein
MLAAAIALFGFCYQHIPELRRVVTAWQSRALMATLGLVLGYALLRLHGSSHIASGPWRRGLVAAARHVGRCLVLGAAPAGVLWAGMDLLLADWFLFHVCEALLPWQAGVGRALALVGLGWAGWSIALGELRLRWFKADCTDKR